MAIKKPRHGHASIESAFNGVLMFIYKNYPNVQTEKDVFKWFGEANALMILFLTSIEKPFKEGNSDKARTFNANKVQDNWADFKKYMKANY